jgi:uncharacterized protein
LKQRLIKFTLLLAGLYLLLITVVYIFQDKIIFQADKLTPDYTFSFDQPFTEITIFARSGQTLNAIIFSTDSINPKGTILYFHGNADNIQRWGQYAVDFTSLGYNVLMIDYSGYGKSTGEPSEEVLYRDAEDTWQWAMRHLPVKNIIIYGRSLGTAVASQLASRHQPKQLILETPFYQLKQDHLKFLFPFGLKYQFANYKYLPEIKCPIAIFQGTNDRIVYYKSAAKLKPLLKAGDKFITIDQGSHKNLRQFEQYHRELARALK